MTPSWDERFDLVESLPRRRLADSPPAPRELDWAWRQLVRSGGRVRVRALAVELGWSPRRLIDRFRDHVGLPPKAAARVIRLDRAVSALRSGTPRIAEVAAACGYADQAHLGRELRELGGITPGQLVGGNFVQDDAAASSLGSLRLRREEHHERASDGLPDHELPRRRRGDRVPQRAFGAEPHAVYRDDERARPACGASPRQRHGDAGSGRGGRGRRRLRRRSGSRRALRARTRRQAPRSCASRTTPTTARASTALATPRGSRGTSARTSRSRSRRPAA